LANISENAQKILEKRYFINGETTAEQMFRRVAHTIAQAEKEELQSEYEEQFFKIQNEHDFIANSPCYMNAGTNIKQFSACFVLPVEDNIESIYDSFKFGAIISKTGGGTGFSYSHIRPNGSKVGSTNGVASGPISWMKIQNASTEEIKQGGKRRGANMGCLRIDHPNIEDLICCKDQEGILVNFNISIAITDEFIDAVKNDGLFNLQFNGVKYKEIKAKELFHKICEHAWKTGDPGVIFIDEINRHNPTPHIGEIESTNPCVTGDTMILTDNGYIPIQDLVGQKINIWNGFEFSEVEPRITGKNQEILDVEFSDGSNLSCTMYHGFYLANGSEKEAKELRVGDKLIKYNFPIIEGDKELSNKEAYTAGFFSGDGSAESNRNRQSIWLYGIKKELLKYFDYELVNECANDRLFVKLPVNKYEKEFVPDNSYTVQTRLNWLAGLIDSDGSLNEKSGSVSISSCNKDFLNHIKLMLNTISVNSVVAKTKEIENKFMPDGKGGHKQYNCQESYRLLIRGSAIVNLVKLGLITYRVKLVKTISRDAGRFVFVKSIAKRKQLVEHVYCFNEPVRHMGCFNGIVTAQCGEQPLLPFEACNLGSINLANMVKNDKVDFDRLSYVTKIAVRFLDDVITVSEFPLPQITKQVNGNRKIGLGVMGWADLLFKLNITYGNEESFELAEQIMKHINNVALTTSKSLAVEKGKYPNCIGTPVRNATRTTIAPTGTISQFIDVWGGIEPLFGLVWTRTAHSMNNLQLYNINPIFKQRLEQLGLYTEDILNKITKNNGSIQGIKEIPQEIQNVFVIASDITPENHIKMQAAFQKYTDNAVSKTINMSNSATVEDVEKAYLLAYELGCKGLTIYRDGSKSNQPLNVQQNNQIQTQQEFIQVKPPLEEAYGKRKKYQTGCGSIWLKIFNDEEGNLREIFSQSSGGGCKANIETISRLVSLLLRANVDPGQIIDQLSSAYCKTCYDKTKCKSCGDVIAKQIKRFLDDGIKIIPVAKNEKPQDVGQLNILTIEPEIISNKDNSILCPDCGEKLQLMEGCNLCASCGYSKCS